MEDYSKQKLKIFLWLALRRIEKSAHDAAPENSAPEEYFKFTAQLSKPDAEKFLRLQSNHQNKSADEQQKWNQQIAKLLTAGESPIDKNIHWSHLDAALKSETPAIQRIIVSMLASAQQNRFETEKAKTENSIILKRGLKKAVSETFARQFVALKDLPQANAFDRLSGEQFARLARLAGIREVALACVRIPAVESVAAFLRRFPAEDARAIAAQLSSLPQLSDERLSFAENIVQSALELEKQPSAMLDLVGIWLVGILLCNEPAARIAYTAQKLPFEVSPKLSEIIELQCRQTPTELQNVIGAEIEELAETVRAAVNKNHVET